jgi:glycosyltransferase involved in cell wall biosynthesis
LHDFTFAPREYGGSVLVNKGASGNRRRYGNAIWGHRGVFLTIVTGKTGISMPQDWDRAAIAVGATERRVDVEPTALRLQPPTMDLVRCWSPDDPAPAERRRIKITHIITGLQTGGAEHALEQLVTRVDAKRFDMRVVSLRDAGTVGPRLAALGVPVTSLNMRHTTRDLLRFGRLVMLLRRDRPDIVQTWLYHADLIGLAAARLAGVSQVLWNLRGSGLEHHHYDNRFRWVVRMLARLSGLPDAIVANAEAGRSFHAQAGYRPRRWAMIDNAIDVGRFRPFPAAGIDLRNELNLAAGSQIIGMTARLDPMKDHATFFRAAATLIARGIDVHFVLIGRGVDRNMVGAQPFLADPRLASRLHFLGEREDVARLVAGFDLAVLSSAFGEGFPNAVAEAMACGVPVVSTDVGDAGRIIGEAGLLVAPRDALAIADACQILLTSPTDRAAMGRAGRARIARDFGPERMVDAYGQLYEQIQAARHAELRPA